MLQMGLVSQFNPLGVSGVSLGPICLNGIAGATSLVSLLV